MSTELISTSCCALGEIEDLGHSVTAEDAMLVIARQVDNAGRRLVYFTGVVQRENDDHSSDRDDDYGQTFADYIIKHNLGNITAVPPVTNIHTGNVVGMWVWSVDTSALRSWIVKHTPLGKGLAPDARSRPQGW